MTINEQIDKIYKLASEIRNDWTDPRSECREIWSLCDTLKENIKQLEQEIRSDERNKIIKIMETTTYGDLSISTFIENVEKKMNKYKCPRYYNDDNELVDCECGDKFILNGSIGIGEGLEVDRFNFEEDK